MSYKIKQAMMLVFVFGSIIIDKFIIDTDRVLSLLYSKFCLGDIHYSLIFLEQITCVPPTMRRYVASGPNLIGLACCMAASCTFEWSSIFPVLIMFCKFWIFSMMFADVSFERVGLMTFFYPVLAIAYTFFSYFFPYAGCAVAMIAIFRHVTNNLPNYLVQMNALIFTLKRSFAYFIMFLFDAIFTHSGDLTYFPFIFYLFNRAHYAAMLFTHSEDDVFERLDAVFQISIFYYLGLSAAIFAFIALGYFVGNFSIDIVPVSVQAYLAYTLRFLISVIGGNEQFFLFAYMQIMIKMIMMILIPNPVNEISCSQLDLNSTFFAALLYVIFFLFYARMRSLKKKINLNF